MPFDRIMHCVIQNLTTVPFLQVCKLHIGERASNIREHREIDKKSVLSEEATHTHEIGRRHEIIQNEQFSEQDSDQDSIEIRQNAIRFDH